MVVPNKVEDHFFNLTFLHQQGRANDRWYRQRDERVHVKCIWLAPGYEDQGSYWMEG
jgi:hypothetical protein